jgi:hypothetical protein
MKTSKILRPHATPALRRTLAAAAVAVGVALFSSLAASAQAPGGERPERGGPGGPGGRGGGMMRMLPLMTALDTDQDGELSAAEIEKAVAALKTLDKNKDGKLSATSCARRWAKASAEVEAEAGPIRRKWSTG